LNTGAQLADTIASLLWDKKPRSVAMLAKALELHEGTAWAATHQQEHDSIEDFLKKHNFEFEAMPILMDQVPRYQLSREYLAIRHPLPIPGFEDLDAAIAKMQPRSSTLDEEHRWGATCRATEQDPPEHRLAQ
jgi:hypothetical protein